MRDLDRARKTKRARALIAALMLPAGLAAGAARAAEKEESPGPVRVHVAGVRMVGDDQALVVLADDAKRRAVPIAVGRDQGIAILLGRERTPTPRPMTHDLIIHILKALKASVEKITITELKQDTYYAEISLRAGDGAQHIDARPSDAIAVAVRLDAPIYASPELLRIELESDPPGLVARREGPAAVRP